MYESYFELEVKPFELLPNPEFIYLSKSHKRAMTYLDYGIRERAGFILLTGEIGSGKTTLIRDLIKKHRDDMVLSKVFNTNVDSQELLSLIVEDFGVPVQGKDKFTLFRDLNDFLVDQYARGGRPVVIIDEAQNLAPEQLEEIRMLSNLETDTGKLLQIMLVGQPELRKTLSSPRLVQLRQRISINCHLQPLSSSEITDYILHRLHMAGNREALTFSPEALETIYKYSRGIPRLINIICDFLLLAAFAEEVKHVGGEMVKEIIGDLDFENHYWGEGVEVHGDTLPSQLFAKINTDEELKFLLRDINMRLFLERESSKETNDILINLQDKIASLEATLGALKGNNVSAAPEEQQVRERANVPKVPTDDEKERPGMLRRILGA